jgi:hypothetical protein
MKSEKLCSGLVVLFIALLSASVVHADEPGAVGVEETVSETGEPAEEEAYASGRGGSSQEARLKRRGTALMASSFVVQGLSFGMLVASLFSGELTYATWVVHLVSIPFAPLVVTGFADRFGGSSPIGRLHWTGMGLLYAAAYSGLVGGVGVFSSFWEPVYNIDTQEWAPFTPRRTGLILSHFAPGVAHLAVEIGLVTAGGLCVGRARAQARRQGESQSRRPAARAAHRGFVVPTMAPRAEGLTLGVVGVF